MRLPATFIAAALSALSPLSGADTIINGGNIVNQTWTAANSPYIVQGDITVPAGSTLTIQPGVTVQFASTDALAAGLDTARVEFTVRGTLNASGTAANPINFQAQTGTAAGTWFALISDASTSSITLSNTTIRHAFNGLRVNNGAFQTARTTLSNNTLGVYVRSTAVGFYFPVLNGLSITNNSLGVLIEGSSSPRFENCYIARNNGTGLSNTEGASSAARAIIINCTVTANGAHGIDSPSSSPITIANTIVTSHTTGISRAVSSGPMIIVYCDTVNNTVNYNNATPGTGCISLDPRLDASSPRLLDGSPCIDAADPNSANGTAADFFGTPRPIDGDNNGSAITDIGAFEYSCGTPVSITAPPSPTTVAIGHPFSFSVAATGTSLTYQWHANGTPLTNIHGITGATSATLTIDAANPADAGAYDVTVSNACGAVTSTAATLTLTPACGSADFNGDGDLGTDADIEAFFRVLAGGNC